MRRAGAPTPPAASASHARRAASYPESAGASASQKRATMAQRPSATTAVRRDERQHLQHRSPPGPRREQLRRLVDRAKLRRAAGPLEPTATAPSGTAHAGASPRQRAPRLLFPARRPHSARASQARPLGIAPEHQVPRAARRAVQQRITRSRAGSSTSSIRSCTRGDRRADSESPPRRDSRPPPATVPEVRAEASAPGHPGGQDTQVRRRSSRGKARAQPSKSPAQGHRPGRGASSNKELPGSVAAQQQRAVTIRPPPSPCGGRSRSATPSRSRPSQREKNPTDHSGKTRSASESPPPPATVHAPSSIARRASAKAGASRLGPAARLGRSRSRHRRRP